MKHNTKNRVKGGLLALLLAAVAARGFADQRTGIVIMKRDDAPDRFGNITTGVFIDTDNDAVPDTVLYIPDTNADPDSALLDMFIHRNSEISFEDEEAINAGKLLGIFPEYMISLDGLYMFEMFPEYDSDRFPYAEAYRGGAWER